MAIAFELWAHFGADLTAAKQFIEQIKQRYRPIPINSYSIELHEPLLWQTRNSSGEAQVEVAVLPVAVGEGVAIDKKRPRLCLTSAELTQLEHKLYELLRGLSGYRIAAVGWEVDYFDVEALQIDYQDELMNGSLDGIVIDRGLRTAITSSSHFVPFDDHYDWIPYRGTAARDQL